MEEGADKGEEDVNDAAKAFLVDDVGLAYPFDREGVGLIFD